MGNAPSDAERARMFPITFLLRDIVGQGSLLAAVPKFETLTCLRLVHSTQLSRRRLRVFFSLLTVLPPSEEELSMVGKHYIRAEGNGEG